MWKVNLTHSVSQLRFVVKNTREHHGTWYGKLFYSSKTFKKALCFSFVCIQEIYRQEMVGTSYVKSEYIFRISRAFRVCYFFYIMQSFPYFA